MQSNLKRKGPRDVNTQKKIIRLFVNILLIELGLAISSAGTALFYAADLGSGAMATFSDGLHLLLHINYGDANMLANIVLLVALFFLKRSYINIGTVLCVFTIGPWVNLFTPMFAQMNIAEMNMVVRILVSLAGTACMGLGLGLYVAVDCGLGAMEGIVMYCREKFHMSVGLAKIIQDVVLTLPGILLGAAWGVGTLIAMFCTGPVLQASSKFCKAHLIPLCRPENQPELRAKEA